MCATDDSLVSVQTVSHLFPFSVRNRLLWSSYVQTLDTICVIENRDSFFFSRHAQLPLGLWLRALQCEWINILLRTPSIWFLLDRNSLCFSLHLSESVVREIQKTRPSVIVIFYLLLVASLRFSLVYLCVQFVFSAAVLHFLVRWISRLMALWS